MILVLEQKFIGLSMIQKINYFITNTKIISLHMAENNK